MGSLDLLSIYIYIYIYIFIYILTSVLKGFGRTTKTFAK